MLEGQIDSGNPRGENSRINSISAYLAGITGTVSILLAGSVYYIAEKFYVEPNKTSEALDLDRAPQPDSKCTVVATDIGTKSTYLDKLIDGTYNPDSDLAKRFSALVRSTNNGVSETGAILYLCMIKDDKLSRDPILDPLSGPYWDMYPFTGSGNTIVSIKEFNQLFITSTK